jgi:hypothetical protein
VTITSNVAAPAGTLTLHCPTIAAGSCAGGSFTYRSNDGTTTIGASFTSGKFTESCAGGGRGGHGPNLPCGTTAKNTADNSAFSDAQADRLRIG